MIYEKIKHDIEIPKNAFVSVKEMNDIIEITFNSNRNSTPQIIKLSSEEYCVTRTGEIKKYQKNSNNRFENKESIQKTLKKIKDLIQNNVVDTKNVRWCTLTYKENMRDSKKLYDDLRKFNQRFQRYLKRRGIDNAEYIMVVEPQERGAWHCHVLYIFKNKAPYIPNKDFSFLWNNGFTKITKLDNITNIAVYLMAYLSDIEISVDEKEAFYGNEVKELTIDGEKKAFIKGRRLALYPRGMNILRHSKGIKYPEIKRMSLSTAMKKVKDKKLAYHSIYRLSNKDGYSTIIDKKEYRKNKEGFNEGTNTDLEEV